MTTITAIVGLIAGYAFGMSRLPAAIIVTASIEGATIIYLTWKIASGNASFSSSSTAHDPGYWISQVLSLVLAIALTWAGAKLAERMRSRRETVTTDAR